MVINTFTLEDRNEIRRRYSKFNEWDCPYSFIPDLMESMTPIEKNIWELFRENGIIIYPQYPVLNYFIDFADPIKKIWIEVDGHDYHLDKDKDKRRELELNNQWWQIYRIDWKHTFSQNNPFIRTLLMVFWKKSCGEFENDSVISEKINIRMHELNKQIQWLKKI